MVDPRPTRVRTFISYRRSDAPHVAGRLRDRLAQRFSDDDVFFDVDSIEFGVDFREAVKETIARVDAVLVVIGPQFDVGRLSRTSDFVRQEITEAFRQRKLTVPVLVDRAELPNAGEVPAELEQLLHLNAARLRPDPDFRRDADRLIESISRTVEAGRRTSPQPANRPAAETGRSIITAADLAPRRTPDRPRPWPGATR